MKKTILGTLGQSILKKLFYPFQKDLLFFLILWIVISLPNCFLHLSKDHFAYGIYLLMLYYIISYLIVLILDLNNSVAKILKPIILVIALLFSIVNLYCIHVYNCMLSHDFIQIIAGTNLNEAKEYIDTFVSWKYIILIVVLLIASGFLGCFLSQNNKLYNSKLWLPAAILLFLSSLGIWHNSDIIIELSNKSRWLFSFDEVIDLSLHPTYPQIEESENEHPSHVVVILGESFSPNHSSLYGYVKQTNPQLIKKRDEGNLFVFPQITSPSTYTTAAFKYLLNTYQKGKEENLPWYEHTNLIEVMKAAGYHTYWFSNQLEKGMYDNLPSGYSKLCDKSIFLKEKEDDPSIYDGNLTEIPISYDDKICIFYHLMGQHEAFDKRYPSEFEHFTADQYKDCPENQRTILAAYDNATLYNDKVVNDIMNKFKNEDAIVFYFSDHALDVFDTDPSYFGHAKATSHSRAHAMKIPFMIYVSPIFRDTHTDKVEMIKSSIGNNFCVDKFIYAVMDATGFKFANNDDVNTYSLFKNVK